MAREMKKTLETCLREGDIGSSAELAKLVHLFEDRLAGEVVRHDGLKLVMARK